MAMQRRSLLIVLGIVVLVLLAVSLLLGTLERGMALYQQASEAGPIALTLLIGTLLAFTVLTLWFAWWLFGPRSGPSRQPAKTEAEIAGALADAEQHGIDTRAARAEMDEWQRRRDGGELFVSLFGEISTGKSALIRALLPDADAPSDVRGGTTVAADEHVWSTASGDSIHLIDAPGLNDPQPELGELARAEAQRAHIVIHVCDGDLTRSQWQELDDLAAFDKPLIVALNKMDRYGETEREQIRTRIESRLATLDLSHSPQVVQISSGGDEELIRVDANGNEQRITRARQPQLVELLAALQQQLETDPQALSQLCDQAVLNRVASRLDIAATRFRRERSAIIIRNNTRAAVVGALAAISPGSDLVIQGVLATKLVRELSALYDVPAREVDIEGLLKAANDRLRKSTALILAVAGNGLKAFPGIGTVAGGLTHAVAYGLLFDSFGRALVSVLEERGKLHAGETINRMEDIMQGDLLPRAKRMAQLAWETRRQTGAGHD